MNSDVLKVLDLFNLDESVIDERLILLTSKTEHTVNHLKTILCLIQYKYLINQQEESDCENDMEISFAAKLLSTMDDDNIDLICKIIKTSLLLNKEKISFHAEHFLHQIFLNLQFETSHLLQNITEAEIQQIMYWLKIIDSIIDAAIVTKSPIRIISEDVTVENLLYANSDKVTLQMMTSFIPKLVMGTKGYHILDKIWFAIRERKDKIDKNDYIILSSLSDFYLPMSINGKVNYSSSVIEDDVFWNMIIGGFLSEDLSTRKYALFLAKRALDSTSYKSNDLKMLVSSHNNTVVSRTEKRLKDEIKSSWQNLFVLLESLEEKQCNIVLGAMPLFYKITTLDHRWVSCALQLALQHESSLVVQEAVKTALTLHFPKSSFCNTFPMKKLLNSLNNNFLYEIDESITLKMLIQFLARQEEHLISFLEGYNSINWSPVPRLYTTYALTNVTFLPHSLNQDNIVNILTGILKQPCNNLLINNATQILILKFVLNNLAGLNFLIFYKIMESTITVVQKYTSLWDSFVREVNMHYKENDVLNILKSLIKHQNSIEKKPVNVASFMIALEAFPLSINVFVSLLEDVLANITNINSREYADKATCKNDFSFIAQIIQFLVLQNYEEEPLLLPMRKLLIQNIPNLFLYLYKYLSCVFNESLSDIELMSSALEQIVNAVLKFNINNCDEQPNLYKMAILCLRKDNNNHIQKYLAVKILVVYSHFYNMRKWTEILDVKDVIFLLSKDGENIDGVINNLTGDSTNYSLHGKLKTSSNEALCELLFYTVNDLDVSHHVFLANKDFINLLSNIIFAGGYGCLYWIMKTFTCLVKYLDINTENIDFITNFINICWKETLQLKSNEQFKPCMGIFIEMAFNQIWLNYSITNDFHEKFGSQVIQLGLSSNTAPYCLVKHLETFKEFNSLELLTELLLFGGVLRKDQRIETNACKFVLKKGNIFPMVVDCDEYQYVTDQIIRSLAVKVLLKVDQDRAHFDIGAKLREKVEECFGNRVRYHENSQHHRILLRSLQHNLFLLLIRADFQEISLHADWCVKYLGKMPHQTNVRIYLEWYIAIYIVIKDIHLNEQTVEDLNLNSVPQTSLFTILYHVTKHRILHKIPNTNYLEAEFVIETLLSYTMGQIFSTRLYAQYLACKLHRIYASSKPENKYFYICHVIQQTFKKSDSEKSYLKIYNDSYINDFDIIANLTPQVIYYNLPKYTGAADEEIADLNDIPSLDICVTPLKTYKNQSNIIHKFLLEKRLTSKVFQNHDLTEVTENEESTIEIDSSKGAITIQKKFVPWKSMLSEIGLNGSLGINIMKKSGLIVVASLIDRLPNLGGLARTCEVFGAKKYVIDSLRHIQDKQFQSLSVSAERWIDIEEVRPGNALKEYIKRMKAAGYVVVAAEQTSSSITLDHFNFPENTLLILGHEKEGVPCDLLPLMDHCVEIPQRGFVRSLNVHVTAAIFVWEYVKQHPIVKL